MVYNQLGFSELKIKEEKSNGFFIVVVVVKYVAIDCVQIISKKIQMNESKTPFELNYY